MAVADVAARGSPCQSTDNTAKLIGIHFNIYRIQIDIVEAAALDIVITNPGNLAKKPNRGTIRVIPTNRHMGDFMIVAVKAAHKALNGNPMELGTVAGNGRLGKVNIRRLFKIFSGIAFALLGIHRQFGKLFRGFDAVRIGNGTAAPGELRSGVIRPEDAHGNKEIYLSIFAVKAYGKVKGEIFKFPGKLFEFQRKHRGLIR